MGEYLRLKTLLKELVPNYTPHMTAGEEAAPAAVTTEVVAAMPEVAATAEVAATTEAAEAAGLGVAAEAAGREVTAAAEVAAAEATV